MNLKEDGQDDLIEPIEQGEFCEKIRWQYEELHRDQLRIKLENEIHTTKLQNQLNDMQEMVNDQKKQIKNMKRQITRRHENLEKISQELRENLENQMSKDQRDILEVRILLSCLPQVLRTISFDSNTFKAIIAVSAQN